MRPLNVHALAVSQTLIEIAESQETWDAAVALADKNPFIYAA